MSSQPRFVILLIFLGFVFMIAGFGLLLIPLLGPLSYVASIFLLAVGLVVLILAGCLSRRF
ncbi:MAG: hypothetical protein ACFE9D_07920 [Promethearchaeota archaeon]